MESPWERIAVEVTMGETIWDKEIDVPETVIEYVDSNVLAKLPQPCNVIGIFPHGASYWTRTAEIRIEQEDSSKLSFFLKVFVLLSIHVTIWMITLQERTQYFQAFFFTSYDDWNRYSLFILYSSHCGR